MMLVAIAVCVFGAVAFAGLGFVLESESRRRAGGFAMFTATAVDDDVPDGLKASVRERILQPLLARLNDFARRLTPASSAKQTALQLDRAGRPWGLAPHTWTLLRLTAAVVSVAAGVALSRILPPHGPLRSFSLLGFAGAGLMGPGIWLDRKIKQRQMLIKAALPDVLDLLVVSVEAGMGLDGAVNEVISRRRGPLLDELARVLTEVRVGKSRRAAWQEMALRVDLLELKVFVAALVQAEELGASIAGVLRSQSEALRTRRSLAIREIAAALPVKMLFPLIFCIFPGIFIVILGPGMINIISTFKDIGF